MFQITWECASAIFSSKLVCDYLFPVVSGVFLTFLTANVIRFRDLQKEAISTRFYLNKDIEAVPEDTSYDDWRPICKNITTKLHHIGYGFSDAGQWKAFEVTNRVSQAMWDHAFFAHAMKQADVMLIDMQPDLIDEQRRAEKKKITAQLKKEMLDHYYATLMDHHRALQGMRPNALALLDLQWTNGWFRPEKRRQRLAHYKRRLKRFVCGERCCRGEENED